MSMADGEGLMADRQEPVHFSHLSFAICHQVARFSSPLSALSTHSPAGHSADRFSNVAVGNALAIEQLFWFAAARKLAYGNAVHANPRLPDGPGHRVAYAARRVMILDRDDMPARCCASCDQRFTINWRDRVQID